MLFMMLSFVIIANCDLPVSESSAKNIDLLKHIKTEYPLKCSDKIQQTGIYFFENEQNQTPGECNVTIVVPGGHHVTLKVHKEDCTKSRSLSIQHICKKKVGEMNIVGKNTSLILDRSDMFQILVYYSEVIQMRCQEFIKNGHSTNNKTLELTYSSFYRNCRVALPAAVRIQFIDFVQESERSCSPDLLIISTNASGYPIDYEYPIYATDLEFHNIFVRTRCRSPSVEFRNMQDGDKIYFRLTELTDGSINSCTSYIEELGLPPGYRCRRRRSKTRAATFAGTEINHFF